MNLSFNLSFFLYSIFDGLGCLNVYFIVIKFHRNVFTSTAGFSKTFNHTEAVEIS